ncbi:MAG TPA: hypothetical protein VJP40_05890 [bacterium]|nr:hypothetical protein [bacterium]
MTDPKSISRNREYYTDQYGVDPLNRNQATGATYESEFSDTVDIDGNVVPDEYQEFFSESNQAPGDDGRLLGDFDTQEIQNELQGGAAPIQWNDAATGEAKETLDELKAKLGEDDAIESMDEDLRKDLLDKIKDLKAQVGKAGVDPEELEESIVELKDQVEAAITEALETNPPFSRQINERLAAIGINLSDKQIKEALEDSGFSEEELNALRFPTDASTSQKLLELCQSLDSTLSIEADDDPYKTSNVESFSQILSAVLNRRTPITQDDAVGVIDHLVSVSWDEDVIFRNLTGRAGTAANANETGDGDSAPNIIRGITNAIRSGSTSALHSSMWGGMNDVERKHHWRNDSIRQVVSAIWEAADRNPHMFRRMMKLIPEQILKDFRDVVLSHSGELNEQHTGDRFNSQTTSTIVDWVIAGGPVPSALGGSTAPSSSTPPPAS